jgi:hypothetical protein
MRTTVYASFTSAEDAEKAIGALLDHGVATEDLGVALNEKYRPYTSDENKTAGDIIGHADSGITVTTPDDMGSGAAKGAGVGLGIGALAAIASIAIPGFGLVVGGGALAAAIGGMVGATAAGAIAGGAVGYMKDQGLPQETAERYTMAIGEGGAVVSVSVPSKGVADYTVEEILRKYGGSDVHHLSATPTTAVVSPIEDAETAGRRTY